MKILVLAALIAAVSTNYVSNQAKKDRQSQGPWQIGRLYRYEVDTYTLARLPEGPSSGSAFKAQFIIRVLKAGHLQARLLNSRNAQVHQELPSERQLPEDLKYQPLKNMDQTLELSVEGGRVLSMNLPSGLPLHLENLLKGLVSALQVDLSAHRFIGGPQYGYDKEVHQGTFKKMETDVTGDCETMYNVYPAIPEWRRELPNFVSEGEPIMVSKTKNYGHCHHRVAYHFGVPEGSEWANTAHKNHEEQFMRRATVSRILMGKQGPIYKTESTSTVHVSPQLYSKVKAEVISYVQLYLSSHEQDSEAEWPKLENSRVVNNLLYSVSQKQAIIDDNSSESSEEYSESRVQKSIDIEKRVRRSLPTPRNVEFNKIVEINKVSNYAASSSSSSDDSTSTFENDDIPRMNEPAYAALYMSSSPRNDKKQTPMLVQKLVQEAAQQLQNPNNLPKADFLTKFNIIVRLIASMSYEQLSSTSRLLEPARTSNNIVQVDMWMIYRDAVPQAGTMPAFQQIKSWILTKKLKGEEAAEVVTSLAVALRYPTKEIMTQFFDLAMSDEVRQQSFLSTSALIAATRFINMGQVNNETAHMYYPTHMYGRLARQHDTFVLDDVLPRLSKELNQAVEGGDIAKAQIFIKAIGNVGHRNILQVFAPYLEGKLSTTTQLRIQIVRSLQVLAYQKDDYVKLVLFSILKNIALPYEMRVAAIDGIFMANPNNAMMTAMAQMTRNDPSVQVRAMLKSSIESAAKLKNPRYTDLARRARAVKWLITKQNYGKKYSSKHLVDSYDLENELGDLAVMSFAGSEDHMSSKYLRYSFKNKAAGWNRVNSISASVSSMKQLYNILTRKYLQNGKNEDSDNKFSAQKIAEMLNIKSKPQKPLQGDLAIDFMGQQRYFSFDETHVKQLPEFVAQSINKLVNGLESHYTKVLNQAQVSVMFPLISGMPFVYKYKEPMVVHMQSKLKLPKPHEYEAEIQITYARNLDGSVGFMDTLSDHYASVGVVNKLQISAPFKLQLQSDDLIEMKNIKLSLEPLNYDQDNTIIHFSVWPYSAFQKKDSATPVSMDPESKLLVRDRKEVDSLDFRFFQSLGTTFQLQGYSYSSDYNDLNMLIDPRKDYYDIITQLSSYLYQKDIAQTHFNLRYLGKQSETKRVSFTYNFDTKYSTETTPGSLEATKTADVSPSSNNRRNEMLARVSSNINSPNADVIDLSASFEGPKKQEYVLTAAVGRSSMDVKVQYAIFAGRNSEQLGNKQFNGVSRITKPAVTLFNLLEALKTDMQMNFTADFVYGEHTSAQLRGYVDRTKKYTEELLNHPLTKHCSKEIAKNNLYQYPCYEMIVRAHAPNHFKALATYNDTDLHWNRFVEMVKPWLSSEMLFKLTPNDQVEIEADISYSRNIMSSFSLSSNKSRIVKYNIPLPSMASRGLMYCPLFKNNEMIENQRTSDQFMPFCTIDGNKIRTFSNRSYDYTLTRSWHVVMVNEDQQDDAQVVVLAKRPNENQQEVYISFSDGDLNVELELQPATGESKQLEVKTKAKLSGVEITPASSNDYRRYLQKYVNANGDVILNIREGSLRVMYDGNRLVVVTDNNRGKIRGLCGRMTGDARDDYLTPSGLVDRPDHYGASYALKEADIDPKTQELLMEAQNASYSPKQNEHMAILPADEEWKSVIESKDEGHKTNSWYKKIYKSVNFSKKRGQCQLQSQTQYYEDNDVICISMTPLPSCPSHCKSDKYKVQAAQVTCSHKLNKQFREYKKRIHRGEAVKVVKVPEKLPRHFQVPTACIA